MDKTTLSISSCSIFVNYVIYFAKTVKLRMVIVNYSIYYAWHRYLNMRSGLVVNILEMLAST